MSATTMGDSGLDNSTKGYVDGDKDGTASIIEFLKIYLTPMLLFAGTIGNILSLVVFSRPALRASPTAFYFRVLAIADTLALNVGLWPNWMRDAFGVHLYPFSDTTCRAQIYLKYFLPDCAVWVLVLMTVERCIDVWWPHTTRRICTWTRIWLSVPLLVVTLAAINIPTIWITRAGSVTGRRCVVHKYQLAYLIWPWVDLTIYSLLPFVIMLVCNGALIHVVFSRHKGLPSEEPGALRSQMRALTVILLTVTFVFLLLTAPFVIYAITVYHFHGSSHVDYMLFYFIASYLRYVNNVINFPLYCLSGRPFRKELKLMFCKSNANEVTGSSNSDPDTVRMSVIGNDVTA